MTALDRLATAAGIEPAYRDYFGVERTVSDETKRALLAAMGFSVADEPSAEAALREFEERVWRRRLEPVIVQPVDAPGLVVFAHRSDRAGVAHGWSIALEDGAVLAGTIVPNELEVHEAREVDGARLERRRFTIPHALPLGYHHLRLEDGATEASTTIAVTPAACYVPPELETGRTWGLAAQLYSLRSRENAGIGDFRDLGTLARIVADRGGATLGVNPLHELGVRDPQAASPYSPSSRLLLNPLYLALEPLPGFRAEDLDPAASARLRREPLVDYVGVAALKRRAFEAAFARFREHDLAPRRATATGRRFRAFVRNGGEVLWRGTVFDALTEHFARLAPERWGWRTWPQAYRSPTSAAVRSFARTQRAAVEFFAYLQWNADAQLEAAARAWPPGTLGLFRDLAVGANMHGADTWASPHVLASPVTVGAPPDPLNTQGQNWGVAPYAPSRLRDLAYAPFIELLRANLRHAGVLRIDHVMALMRLFWIPAGAPIAAGAYVRYPLDELLGIVTLESRRAKCVIVGEDLGNVPDGFRERLAEARLFSIRLLYFERAGERFKRPEEYPPLALVATGTHDLPPFRGWWTGSDIDVRAGLGIAGDDDAVALERAQRAAERSELREAFSEAGVLDEAQLEQAPARVANRFLARTPSRLLMLGIEDVLDEGEQVNVPGTTDQHPNWRRKISLEVEHLAHDPRWLAMTDDLQHERAPERRS